MARKTAAERRLEERAAEIEAFRSFHELLNHLTGFDDIRALVNAPGRLDPYKETLLSNIGYFVNHDFAVPNGATRQELAVYENLINRMGAGLPNKDAIVSALQAARAEPHRRP